MELRKDTIIAILLILVFFFSILAGVNRVFGTDKWVEVARFEGSSPTQRESFTCDYVEWRIRWDIEIRIYTIGVWGFGVTINAEGED